MNSTLSRTLVLVVALALPLAAASSAEAKGGLSSSAAKRAIVKTVGKRASNKLDNSTRVPGNGNTLPDGVYFSPSRVYVPRGACVRRSRYRVGCVYRVTGALRYPDGSRAAGFVCSYSAFAFKTKRSSRVRTRSTRSTPGCYTT